MAQGSIHEFRRFALGLFVAAQLVSAGPAYAQTPPSDGDAQPAADESGIGEARRRYAQGAEFFRRERYAEAVAEFTEAYERWQNPTILYALAQAYEGLTQARRAIETYRQYLETTTPDDPRRREVEARIAELERLLGTLRIESNVPAAVFINGEREDAMAPGTFRVPTGRHSVELRADGYENAAQTVIVAAGTERTLRFELDTIQERVEIVQVERERRRLPRPVFWGALGVTSVAAASWLSVSGVAIAQRRDYQNDPDRNAFQRDDARTWARRSDALLGVTAGLGIGTLVIGLLTDWDRSDETDDEDERDGTPRADLSISNDGVVLQLGWVR